MSDSQSTFEPDLDAFWESWDKQEAEKKTKEAVQEAWRTARQHNWDGSRRTFCVDTQESLPTKLRFQEDRKLYPEYLPMDEKKLFSLEKVYGGERAYRGSDRPIFKKSYNEALALSDQTPALVVLKDSKAGGELVVFGDAFRRRQKDSPKHLAAPSHQNANSNKQQPTKDGIEQPLLEGDERPSAEDEDSSPVEVVFKADSQRPCLSLVFCLDPASEERKVTIDIYGQHLEATDDSIGIEMSTAKHPCVLQGLPTGKELEVLDRDLANLAKDDSLWRTDIYLAKPNSYIVTGVTQEEATAIREKDSTQLTRGERLLNTLSTNSAFSIFVQSPGSEHRALEPFFGYFRSVMYAAAHLGNFWWYALVTTGERDALQQPDFPFDKVPVPRWMITSWRIEYYGNNLHAEPRSAQVQQCARYNPVTDGSRPGPDYFANGRRLVVAREAQRPLLKFEKLSLTKSEAKSSAGLESAEEDQEEEPKRRSEKVVLPAGRGKPPGTGKRSQGRGRGSGDRGRGGGGLSATG